MTDKLMMIPKEYIYPDQKMGTFFLNSMIMHFIIFIIFYFAGYIYKVPSSPQKVRLTLAERSVRVDVVAMPRLTLRELRALGEDIIGQVGEGVETGEVALNGEEFLDQGKEPLKAESEPLKVTSDSETPEYYKLGKKKEFVNFLRGLGQKKVSGSPSGKKGKRKSKFSKKAKNKLRRLLLAGNRLSRGTAVVGGQGRTGEIKEGDIVFYTYISKLPDIVRPYWKLPSYLIEKKLRCRLRIYLSDKGNLTKVTIFESSDNEEYDRRAIDSVKAAEPFPIPAKEIKKRVMQGEILLGFPL